MFVELDLNRNDLDALLRHCREFAPGSGMHGKMVAWPTLWKRSLLPWKRQHTRPS